MGAVISWLSGKKTYLLVLVYVAIQLWQGGGLEALKDLQSLDSIVLASALAAIRAGVSKIGAGTTPPA